MKREILKFLVLLTVALGAGPAYSAFWQWSKTASNNASADPSINFSEGMSPSSVNDSARALMARAAEYRDDISGSIATTGTSTAYLFNSNQAVGGNGITSPPNDGQMLAFRAHATNGANPTITIDGGTAYPLQSAAGVAIASGVIIAGTPYRISFNNAALSYVLEGTQGNPYTIPLGAILWSTAPSPPNSNFVAPSGQCISTTTYATYWVQQGSPASGACPGGQFAIIDHRGRAPVALDTLNASAANRLTNSATGCGTAMTTVGASCANGTQSKTLVTLNLPAYTPSISAGNVTTVFQNIAAPAVGVTKMALAAAGGDGATSAGNTLSLTFNAQGGASQPLPSVDPNIGLIPYLRIL